MEKYYHHYKGIVIQNNDSNNMGRVKVFVPEVNMTLYKDWNSDKDTDKKFTHLGENIESGLSKEILERLKNCLPWAQLKQPIFGMSAPVFYDAEKNVAIIANDSDASHQQNIINKNSVKNGEQQKRDEGNKTEEALKQIAQNDDPANDPRQSISVLNSIVPSWKNSGGDADNCTVKSMFCSQTNETVPSENDVANNAEQSSLANSSNNTIPNDNIVGLIVSFLPDEKYYKGLNLNRGFNANDPKPTPEKLTELTTVVNKTSTVISANYSPPIKYQLAILDLLGNGVEIENDFSESCVFFKERLVTPQGQSFTADDLPVQFIPADTYHKNLTKENPRFDRSFVEKANNVKENQNFFKVNNVEIDKKRITEIRILYTGTKKSVNTSSNRLGGLGNIIKAYKNSNSGLNQAPIMPPAAIPYTPINEFGEFGQYNRGGGGGELFSIIHSDLLPIQNIINNQIGANNPQSVMGSNHSKPFDESVDPNKTKNSNIQTEPNSKPAIRSSTQNNKTKGMISIPAVGAHVSVYFENGNPQFPIIDGCFQAQEEYAGVFDVSNQ